MLKQFPNSFQDVHFIRCILPNYEKRIGDFSEKLILEQLKTSSVVSYAKFVRFGYPKRIPIQKMIEICKSIEEKFKKMYTQKYFYRKVLLTLGFKIKDFKMGNDEIFFRSDKFHLLENFFSDVQDAPILSQEIRKPK